MSVRRAHRGLSTLGLTFAMYCCVSGGPFGLEPLIGAAGPMWAIVLILALPLIWALPDALTTAELSTAMPKEGGYTVWVQRAIGPMPAFLDAWWTWLYTLVDCAVYPALFVQYGGSLLTLAGLDDVTSHTVVIWGTVVAVVGGTTLLNVFGAKWVGRASGLFTALLVAPFLVMCGVGLAHVGAHGVPKTLWTNHTPGLWTALSLGLPVAMWNYQGWDSLSTVAGEVENPERSYPRALFGGLTLVTLSYLLPVLVALMFVPDASQWTEKSWPTLASAVAGPTLGILIAAAALVSQLAQLSAGLLAGSRIPFALAEEGYLPKALAQVSPRTLAPVKSLVLAGFLIIALTYWSLRDLLTLNVVLFSCALALEGIALVVLRRREPEMARPFRIPGGMPAVVLVAVLPVALSVVLVVSEVHEKGWMPQVPTGLVLLSGPILYFAARTTKGALTKQAVDEVSR